ncbi:MAG: hypothetical protein KGI06_01755 [Candidatus Micrarchaeota archaeon]|nr:hypothetical protein [Candidatus Micrarchaeota archaeon]
MALLNATYVNMTEPYVTTVNQNGSVYLGSVGPGETFYVTISAQTTNNTGGVFPIGWDELSASALPAGWIAQNSPLYTPSPSVKIAVSPQAQNGTYKFNITAINLGNYSKLGSLKFTAYVNVTPDVFKLGVTPTAITVGPGNPADIYVTINNTGVSDSPFNITVYGLPAWNKSITVIALHHTEGRFVYPVYENEPGQYRIRLYVSSIASSLVYKQSNITLTTKASIASDYDAIGRGVLAFPITYAPVYAVMYIISLLSRHA